MRTISPALKAAFVNGTRATLVKLITKTGKIYGYTDHDVGLNVLGVNYNPAPGLTRMQLTRSINESVANQEFGSAWIDAPEEKLLAGEFDNAELEISFCDWSNPSNGALLMERGRLGIIQWTADGFRADLQSWMRDLQKTINFPVTASCRHRLFSQVGDVSPSAAIGFCKLDKAAFKCIATINSYSVPKMVFEITVTSGTIANTATWFAGGHLIAVAMPNTSLLFRKPQMIKSSTLLTPNVYRIELYLPMPEAPLYSIELYPGCDKTTTACKDKFNNVINFGGFPHIKPEVLYR